MRPDFLFWLWWLPGAIGSLYACISIQCEPGLCKEPWYETLGMALVFVVLMPVFFGPVLLIMGITRLCGDIWYRGINK